jgi:hypothetical protein
MLYMFLKNLSIIITILTSENIRLDKHMSIEKRFESKLHWSFELLISNRVFVYEPQPILAKPSTELKGDWVYNYNILT